MAAPSNINGAHLLPKGVAFNRSVLMVTTGLTLTITISKNGAAFGAWAGAATELTSGWYKLALTSGDTDTEGDLAYHVDGGGTDIANFADQVAAPVKLDDKVAHGGTPGSSTATFAVQTVYVNNPSGDGIVVLANSTSGNAFYLEAGSGITVNADNGIPLSLFGLNGGIVVNTSVGDAFSCISSGGRSIYAVGASANPSVQFGDGNSGAEALSLLAGSDNTDAAALLAIGMGAAATVTLGDGSNGAEAILALAGTGNTDADAVRAVGAGTGVGFRSTPDAAGFGGGSDPNVILSGTLGDQSLGDADHVVLPSGPSDNSVLNGSRLRMTSGIAQDQERTFLGWNGGDLIAYIDYPFYVGQPQSGDSFVVLYDDSPATDGAGNVLASATVNAFNSSALTQAIGDVQTDGTFGAALLAMESQGVGAWVLNKVAKTLTLYRRDGVTVVRVFDLDSVTDPTTRT